jgi:hypothetical protein
MNIQIELSGGPLTPSHAYWELRQTSIIWNRTCFLPPAQSAIPWNAGHTRTKSAKLMILLLL